MLKNKDFDSKIRKYNKIYIYPRNNNFKNENKISTYKINHHPKLKYNLSNLFLDKNNITEKTKSFLKYYIPKTTSNHNIRDKNKFSIDYQFNSFQRNKSSTKKLKIFHENHNTNNIFELYEEILEELRYIKQNNKSININININNDCQMKTKKKSKSISCLTSKNKLEKINNENNNFRKIKDLFKNNILDIFSNNNLKENINKNIDLKKNINNTKDYLSIDNNKKIKNLHKIYVNGNNKKILSQKRYFGRKHKLGNIKSKIYKINNINKERCKSNPKNIDISNTFENNKSKIKNPTNTEEKKNNNYHIDINEEISNKNIFSINKSNNSFNHKSEKYNIYNNKKSENEENSFIIKERNLPKNYSNINSNVNISLFNEETDSQIQKWINKEKNNKESQKENDKNKYNFFDNINNKKFHNYQISHKYFNNNEIFMNNQINNKKPFKSINLRDYLDLELNKFNNRINKYNNIQKSSNTINTKHIFKPLY